VERKFDDRGGASWMFTRLIQKLISVNVLACLTLQLVYILSLTWQDG
jgi:hypothetical protein